jgi:hypothetical protein
VSVTPPGQPSSWPPPAQGWAPQPPPGRSRSLVVVIVLSVVVALLAVAVLAALLVPRDRTVTTLRPPAQVGGLARADDALILTQSDAEKALEQGAKQAVAVAYGEGVFGTGGFDAVLALEAPPDAVATIRGTTTGSSYQQDGFEVICGTTVLGVGATCFWQADGVTGKADATTLEPDELAGLAAELHGALTG